MISLILNLVMILSAIFIIYDFTAKSAPRIYVNTISSVVELKAIDGDIESFGSAVVVSNEGEFITNYHVITYLTNNVNTMYSQIYVRLASEEDYYEVEVIRYDDKVDLALIRLIDISQQDKFKKIAFSPGDIRAGDTCYAIGNMNSQGISISKGIVSNPRISILLNNETRTYIQSEVNISKGSSGGSLLDIEGRLIGITTLRLKDIYGNPQYGYGYSVPIEIVLDFLGM